MIFHHTREFSYVRISEMLPEQGEAFEEWLMGQTRPMVEGLEVQDAAYSWDYDRWVRSKKGEPVLWD